MLIEFSEKDILRSKIVEPAWYTVKIDSFESKLAGSGKSTNIRLEGTIVKNADTGDTKFAGVPAPYFWFFNTGAIGKMIPLIQAVDPTVEVTPHFRLNMEGLIGKEVEMFIGNGEYNNSITNAITGQYRPVRK
ncbi:MAG TPA: hypothetical protein VNX68_03045 [Nitrosopumilaceae archaeon]|jgi:hypothetical protein|nr:hypothetical protein [Nitrosopumilaceae archaeon]